MRERGEDESEKRKGEGEEVSKETKRSRGGDE